jgi:hypothetical protein
VTADTLAEENRRLQYGDCPSEVTGPTGTYRNRYRLVHAAMCPAWLRYQRRLPDYTAMPSGQVSRCDEPAPPGTTVLLSSRPIAPCGLVVTHRGPYTRRPNE